MKLISLALLASFAVAGYVEAQTTQAPAAPPAESTPAPSEAHAKSHHHPLSKACRQEVKKLCGSTHGDEMKSCVKDGVGANKFSADCQDELAKMHSEKPAS